MGLLENIRTLCKKSPIASIPRLERELGFGNGAIYRWETNSPSLSNLQKVADYFNVSLDQITYDENKSVYNSVVTSPTVKEENDIARNLEKILITLETNPRLAFYDGKPMNKESIEVLRISLETAMRLTKQMSQ